MTISKRLFDIFVSSLLLAIFIWPMAVIVFLVKCMSKGPAIHWSKRVGYDNRLFMMPKFRTMRVETPQLATHCLTNPEAYLTPVGNFLRKTSLDELPQLWSILQGKLSLVGPRPALFNQYDLVALRTEKGIHKLVPGITGWAQINGRDELPIDVKVKYDEYYLQNMSFLFDIKILLKTTSRVIFADGIVH